MRYSFNNVRGVYPYSNQEGVYVDQVSFGGETCSVTYYVIEEAIKPKKCWVKEIFAKKKEVKPVKKVSTEFTHSIKDKYSDGSSNTKTCTTHYLYL